MFAMLPVLLIALVACREPLPPAEIDGCFLTFRTITVDLREVAIVQFDDGSRRPSVTMKLPGGALSGVWARYNPADRARIEDAWKRCRSD